MVFKPEYNTNRFLLKILFNNYTVLEILAIGPMGSFLKLHLIISEVKSAICVI